MAAVLTEPETAKAVTTGAGADLLHFSMPIEKWEDTGDINPVDGTPDLEIWGKVTDGTLDSDLQMVDPDASLRWIKTWYDTKANIRLGHDPKRPVGRGLEIDGHHVKGLIADPVAKHLVRTRVLNDWSVGIMNPEIRKGDPRFRHLDPMGKAVNGVITDRPDGLTQLGEISIVDRGSNFGTAFQLVKAAADGSPEWTGKLTAPDDVLAKAAVPAVTKTRSNGVTVTLPKDMSLSVKPSDLAKLATFRQRLVKDQATVKAAAPAVTKVAEPDDALKAVMAAEQAVYKRDIDTATRRRLAGEGKALPNLSYPVENEGDLQNAAHLAESGHGDVAGARRLIARRARELGVKNPLKGGKKAKKAATKEAGPVVAKKKGKMRALCPGCGAKQNPKHVHCPECGGTLPRTAVQVEKNHDFVCLGCGHDLDKGEKHCPECGKENPGYLPEADKKIPANMGKAAKERVAKKAKGKKAGKGKGKPFGDNQAPAFGARDDDAKDEKDDGEKCKTAAPRAEKKRKGKGKGRSPAAGVKGHEGTTAPLPPHREPDGPAVEEFEKTTSLEDGDQEMKAAMRLKSLGIDRNLGALHDLCCPAFAPADVAKAFPSVTFASIDTAGWQMRMLDAAAKGSAEHAMGQFNAASALWQHAVILKGSDPAVLTDLRVEAHKAFRDANPGPATFPTPSHPMPQQFQRPYISAGHGAASPQHDAPHSFSAPSGQIQAQDYTRGYLDAGHASESPDNTGARPDTPSQPTEGGKPESVHYQGTMRDNARQAMNAMHDHVSRQFPDVCPMSPDPVHAQKPAPAVPAAVGGPEPHAAGSKKTAKAARAKARKAARAQARKTAAKRRRIADRVLKGKVSAEDARAKLGLAAVAEPVAKAAMVEPPAVSNVEPDALKSAVAAALGPVLKQQAKTDKALRKQAKVLNAIADQPDTTAAPFRGVAVAKQATGAPAGPRNAAESAELAQTTHLKMLHHEWRNSHIPEQREAAYRAMTDMLGLNEPQPTHMRTPMT